MGESLEPGYTGQSEYWIIVGFGFQRSKMGSEGRGSVREERLRTSRTRFSIETLGQFGEKFGVQRSAYGSPELARNISPAVN